MVHRKYRDDYFHHHYLESKGYPFYPADMSTCQRAGDLISRNNSSTTLPFFRVWTMDAKAWLDWPQLSRRASGDNVHSVFATSQSSLWVVLIALTEAEKEAPWLVFLLVLWRVAEVTPRSHYWARPWRFWRKDCVLRTECAARGQGFLWRKGGW